MAIDQPVQTAQIRRFLPLALGWRPHRRYALEHAIGPYCVLLLRYSAPGARGVTARGNALHNPSESHVECTSGDDT